MSNEDAFRVPPPDRPELAFEVGQPLPIFARRESIDVVIIPIAEYRDLMALRARATLAASIQTGKAPPAGLSTIEKDREVADLLRSLFRGRMTLQSLHAACIDRFGANRTPSIGRISTFRTRWRRY